MGRDRVTKILIILVAAVLTGALGIVQWFELLSAQEGGAVFCQVGEQFDCLSVWQSSSAKTIHRLTRVPVAGWGVVWAIGAFAAALALVVAHLRAQAATTALGVVRVFAAAGVLTCLVLLAVTLSLGVFCLTCLGTYVLVAGYSVAAFTLSQEDEWQWPQSMGFAAGFVVAGYLMVLFPGLQTPVDSPTFTPAEAAQSTATAPGAVADPVAQVFLRLPPDRRQKLAVAWSHVQRDAALVGKTSPTALTSAAAVRLVEFVDAKCSHCKSLSISLGRMEASLPEGSVERISRVFPLDAECNALMPPEATDGTGIRCAAAKMMVCIDGENERNRVMDKVLEEQQSLTADRVFAIAAEITGTPADKIEACAGRQDSGAKAQEVLQQALSFKLEGTPMVLINGRKVPPIPELIYALILARGDFNHPGFAPLR